MRYLTRGFLERATDDITLTINRHDCCRLEAWLRILAWLKAKNGRGRKMQLAREAGM